MITLEAVRQRAESDAKSHGYYLNPGPQILNSLLEGLRQNENRYGYPACPCRLSSGRFEFDRDIICPCDYRDPDVEEFGYCYCSLYVRKDVFAGQTPMQPIPERRPTEKQFRAYTISAEASVEESSQATVASTGERHKEKRKMWYCKQCGYVCFREEPPYVCPICKAKRELFGEMKIQASMQG